MVEKSGPVDGRVNDIFPFEKRDALSLKKRVHAIKWALVAIWLVLVIGSGWWISNWIVTGRLDDLSANAELEARSNARVIERIFTEMASVANMVARQSQVTELATHYRRDQPDADKLTREQRAAQFTQDPLVNEVGDFMKLLAKDLGYARIYLNNLDDDTITASNWDEADSIVGMIYTGRPYLMNALRDGKGSSFGIARLNKSPSYFTSSRVDDINGVAHGVVTVKFDAPDVALYLAGTNIALVVNRQGRVITASSDSFMLRNLAGLLPPDMLLPPDGDEDPGEPIEIKAIAGSADRWLVEGEPYLISRQPLQNTQYQLITLASLKDIVPMQRQHVLIGLLVAGIGIIVILLSSRVAEQTLMRRMDERYAANVDSLTGLPNRRSVMLSLEKLFDLAKRRQNWVFVAFIDLDGFKAINDTHGHKAGDDFLVEVGRRISAVLGVTDTVGRLGGDEFVVIGLTEPPRAGDLNGPAEPIRCRLAPPLIGIYDLADCELNYLGASFGIAIADPSVDDSETVLKEADRLMYVDKQLRRGQSELRLVQ